MEVLAWPHERSPITTNTLYGKRLKRCPRPKLKVGDRVHLSKKHCPFKKADLPGWTEEVFIVRPVVRGPLVTYQLEQWDGTPLEWTFYEQDLQKVTCQTMLRSEWKRFYNNVDKR